MRTFLIIALALTALVVMSEASEYRQEEEESSGDDFASGIEDGEEVEEAGNERKF